MRSAGRQALPSPPGRVRDCRDSPEGLAEGPARRDTPKSPRSPVLVETGL